MTRSVLGCVTAVLLAAGAAHAAPITFFGENVANGADDTVRGATTTADTQRGLFQTAVPGNTTQNLDALADGTSGPILFSFGSIGATLSGGGLIVSVPGVTTDGQGGFPISNNNLWQVEGTNFQVKLDKKVTAFGFYSIDIGDAGGALSINLNGVPGPAIPHSKTLDTSKQTSGSVFFFGLTNDVPFDTIDFIYGQGSGGVVDRFNFDNFMTGPEAQLAATPEPGTLLLLGSTLAGAGMAARRRRRAARATD
jgi:hypothetical protein